VVQADIFDYLASISKKKFDGIFLAQVVEHLSPDQIVRLVRLCADKLEPGAVIVIETPNSNCPEAMGQFYLDPTHVRPVPVDLLRFIMEQADLQVEYLKFSSPVPGNDVSEVFEAATGLSHIYQDYAAIAHRR
jgi:O-antigen chain-terminating methyltransferase